METSGYAGQQFFSNCLVKVQRLTVKGSGEGNTIELLAMISLMD